MNQRQLDVMDKIRKYSTLVGIDPSWCLAIADQESTMGENQLSPTGARGVFQMTRSAMLELLRIMSKKDDDWNDITAGVNYLRVLLSQYGTIENATGHYCDPKVRDQYVKSVMEKIKVYNGTIS